MDDETSSMSTVDSVPELDTGTETEMVRIEGVAELRLMGGGRSTVIRTGAFVVKVVRQKITSPLSAVFCMVGDHQWPVAKDSPVLRVGLRRFSFSLPGFLYGMALPESCPEGELNRLEDTLMRFCAYEIHAFEEKHDCLKGDFWSSGSLEIENLSNQILAKITGEELKPELPVKKSGEDVSNRVQKAIRMSAIAKLVSKALVKGAINTNFHVSITGPKDSEIQAFASIRAFTDVVDAVETAGRSIVGGCCANDPTTLFGIKFWNFNQSGLALLLRVVAASAMIHERRSSVGRDFDA